VHSPAAIGGTQCGGLGKGGRDTAGARRQQAIGAAEHGVLFVNDCGDTQPGCGEHCRHRGISAEADRHIRREAP